MSEAFVIHIYIINNNNELKGTLNDRKCAPFKLTVIMDKLKCTAICFVAIIFAVAGAVVLNMAIADNVVFCCGCCCFSFATAAASGIYRHGESCKPFAYYCCCSCFVME